MSDTEAVPIVETAKESSQQSKKDDIFLKLKDILDKASDDDFKLMTVKSVREQLTAIFGDEVHQYKGDIKFAISERFMQVKPEVAEKSEGEVGEDDDSDGDEEDSDDEDDDEDEDDNADFAGLPDEWKARYEEVCWIKTSKQYPWWPCLIYDPVGLSKKLRTTSLKNLGKKYVFYYYGSKDYGFATPKQIKSFSENLEEFRSQKMKPSYVKLFEVGLELALKEIELPRSERAMWNHVAKKRKSTKKKVMKVDTTAPISNAKKVTASKTKMPVKKELNDLKKKKKEKKAVQPKGAGAEEKEEETESVEEEEGEQDEDSEEEFNAWDDAEGEDAEDDKDAYVEEGKVLHSSLFLHVHY